MYVSDYMPYLWTEGSLVTAGFMRLFAGAFDQLRKRAVARNALDYCKRTTGRGSKENALHAENTSV